MVIIKCRKCGTETYVSENIRSKKKLFEYGFWECCEFACAQKYVARPKLEFDVF